MSIKVQRLRVLVNERLTAAAEEIFALFERTMAEYEEEMCRSKEENKRKQQLLDSVLKPQVLLHRTGVQSQEEVDPGLEQMENTEESPQIKEEVSIKEEEEQVQVFSSIFLKNEEETERLSKSEEQTDVSSDNHEEPTARLKEDKLTSTNTTSPKTSSNNVFPGGVKFVSANQEEVRPGLEPKNTVESQMKEEVEELSIKQEEEWVQELTIVSVRSEGQPSLLQPIQTEENREETEGEDCGPAEPDVSLALHLRPETEEHTDNSSDNDNDEDWEPPSCSSAQQKETEADGDVQLLHVKDSDKSTAGLNSNPDEKHNGLSAGQSRRHQCCVCEKTFPLKSDLKIHMVDHKFKPFSCSQCDAEFKEKKTLSDHMKVHKAVVQKPSVHRCSCCDKCFSSKSSLRLHMDIHTGAKPFSCPVCEKGFTQKCNLKKHMVVHSGERPFKCLYCDAAFPLKQSLVSHLIVHTGERPFSCSVCGKRFPYKMSLKLHMTTHTGIKPLSCSLCNKGFNQKLFLLRHMRAQHPTPESNL